MRRDPLPLLLVLLLTVLGGLAWFTQDPDNPALRWLSERPRIGPLAERFRDIYRPAPTRPAAPAEQPEQAGEEARSGVTYLERPLVTPPITATSRALGSVWVQPGTELRAAPDEASPVVETVARVRTMTLMEQRGDWRRVARQNMGGERTDGWVRAAELGTPSAAELWQPEPVLPLPAAPPDDEVLAVARELMGSDARELDCGPFGLLTDVTGPLVERCPRLAGQLDRLYAGRTGLEAAGEPAEAILLFHSHGAFLLFRNRVSPESRRHAFAAPARGIVALAAGGRPPEQVQATLVHELVHLLNRRYLGPALPSWLDEGLAEELAMSRIETDGTLVPGSLASWQAGERHLRLLGGGEVDRDGLRSRMRRDELPTFAELVRLDRAGFQAEPLFPTHYSLSAFWVRYLLSGASPAGAGGFRSFLAAVAEGERLDEQLLLSHLGAGWGELESGFRRWLEAETAGSGDRRVSG